MYKGILLTLLSLFATAALASPVLLECVTDYPGAAKGRTYQVTFDESTHAVTRDDRKAVKARISETLITWSEEVQYGTQTWTIDRLSGAWRIDMLNASGTGGTCTAPPPRKF
jgi:hypothetical protein